MKDSARLTRSEGPDYAWADTCSIMKETSFELGTASNPSHPWYSEANLCVAYLEDLRCGEAYARECMVWQRVDFTRADRSEGSVVL